MLTSVGQPTLGRELWGWKCRERDDHERHACIHLLPAFDCGCDWLLEVPALTSPYLGHMGRINLFLSKLIFARVFF